MVVGSLLWRDIAQIDLSDFTKVGNFRPGTVYAMPTGQDPSFATKSMATTQTDENYVLQHCLYISLAGNACDLTPEESLICHCIYKDEDGTTYVDASYSFELGILGLRQYFFLPVDDCEFALDSGSSSELTPITIEELWDSGYLIAV